MNRRSNSLLKESQRQPILTQTPHPDLVSPFPLVTFMVLTESTHGEFYTRGLAIIIVVDLRRIFRSKKLGYVV